ncbi:hypothetical protein A2U01_0071415, partial [Trifolium medium]|nr:hypothetical protein [Trifolium medium]
GSTAQRAGYLVKVDFC